MRYIFIAFAFFFCVTGLSLVNTEDIGAGIRRLEKMLFLFYSFPLYLSLRRLKIDLVSPLLLGFVIAGPVMAIAAVYYVYLLGTSRADGFYSPIIFGNTAMLCALMVLAGLYSNRLSGWYKYVGISSFLCGAYAALLSGTRGSWLALPVVVLLLTVRYFSWRKLIVLICIVVAFALVIMANDQALTRFSSIGVNLKKYQTGEQVNTSVGARLQLWQLAVDLWKEKPVIGVGIGDFRLEVKKSIAEQRTKLTTSYSHAHNIFLDALASTGLCGLIGLIGALFVLPSYFFLCYDSDPKTKEEDFLAVAGLVLLLSFAVFGLTEGWLIHSGLVAVFCFVLTVLLSAASSSKSSCNHA